MLLGGPVEARRGRLNLVGSRVGRARARVYDMHAGRRGRPRDAQSRSRNRSRMLRLFGESCGGRAESACCGPLTAWRAARDRYAAWLSDVDDELARRHDQALYEHQAPKSRQFGTPSSIKEYHSLVRERRFGHSVGLDRLPLAHGLCESEASSWRRYGEVGTAWSSIPSQRLVNPKWGDKSVCVVNRSAPTADGAAAAGAPCRVVSIGSANDFSFELELLSQLPACVVDTFDCTSSAPPAKIRDPRLRFHRICIGVVDELRVEGAYRLRPLPNQSDGRALAQAYSRRKPSPQLSWPSMLRLIGLDDGAAPTLLKIDCEGCEYEVFEAILRARGARLLPAQIVLEIHTAFEPRGVRRGGTFGWLRRAAPPVQTFFQRLYAAAGLVLAHREDGQRSPCCSELVLLKPPPGCPAV